MSQIIQKKVCITISISEKKDFKVKDIIRDKGE